jgi:hypothetical protein
MYRIGVVVAVIACGDASEPAPRPGPPPPPKPKQVTVQEAIKQPPGTLIALDVVVLPELLIRTEDAGTHYYVLAVPTDAPLFAELGAVGIDLGKLAPRADKVSRGPTEATLLPLVNELEAIEKRVNRPKLAFDATIAIEVVKLTNNLTSTSFETVINEQLGVNLAGIHVAPMNMCGGVGCINDQLAELEKADPPNLKRPLPSLALMTPMFTRDDQVAAYNAMVARYNREVARRQRYVASRLPFEVAKLQDHVRDLSTRPSVTITATVAAPPTLAIRTYDKIHQGHPALFVVEQGDSFADRYFGEERLAIFSQPAGATVTIGGKEVGKTPLVSAPLRVLGTVEVHLEAKGYQPVDKTVKVTSTPGRITDLEVVLPRAKR